MKLVVGHGVCVFLLVFISIGVQRWRWMMVFEGDGDGLLRLTVAAMVPQGGSEQLRQLRELS